MEKISRKKQEFYNRMVSKEPLSRKAAKGVAPKRNVEKKILSVFLDPDIHAEFKFHSNSEGSTMSKMVTRMITAYIMRRRDV